LPGTPMSCAQDEYVRRNVSHVAFGRPNGKKPASICGAGLRASVVTPSQATPEHNSLRRVRDECRGVEGGAQKRWSLRRGVLMACGVIQGPVAALQTGGVSCDTGRDIQRIRRSNGCVKLSRLSMDSMPPGHHVRALNASFAQAPSRPEGRAERAGGA
jgi:hypothetical protein